MVTCDPKEPSRQSARMEFTSWIRPVITGLALSHTNSAVSFETLLGMGYDIEKEPTWPGATGPY